jgi:predicted transposase/invertase (TIGR01784 family)
MASKAMKKFPAEIVNVVSKLVPIDDSMFQKICEDIATCQEIISTILGEQVKVIRVIPQDSIGNLKGRAVRLDCLCQLENGVYVNVEVQKRDDDDHQARVRYNAAVIAANETPKGVKFEDIARIIVIYISKFDIYKSGLPIYHVDRTIRETGQKPENGFDEIYVNATAKKYDTELNRNVSDLMDLFVDRETLNVEKFPAFSKQKNAFTNTEKGEIAMCEKVQKEFESMELFRLFGYVQRGSMKLTPAAREANLPPKEFKRQMIMSGFSVPETGRKTTATAR